MTLVTHTRPDEKNTRVRVHPGQRPRHDAGKLLPQIATERIGPAEAAEYLKDNAGNRRVRRSIVKLYASMMTKGVWGESNDMICFDTLGRLLNGQHRLLAVIESGTAQAFVVRRGMDRGAFKNMDAGPRRNVQDALTVLGFEYSSVTSSVAKRLAFYAKAGRLSASVANGSNSYPGKPLYADAFDVLEVAGGYEPTLASAAFAGKRSAELKKVGITPAQMSFAHALFTPWHEGFEDFATRLLRRDFRGGGDPANALLDRVLLSLTATVNSPARLHAAAIFGYLVLAANADFRGRSVSKLQWPRGSGYPQPLVQIASRITAALGWPPPHGEAE